MKSFKIAPVTALAILFFGISTVEMNASSRPSEIEVAFNTRTYNVTKQQAPNSAQAILLAEKANPGWKVQSIKELGNVWHMTMIKP
jgi:hypothetical protein